MTKEGDRLISAAKEAKDKAYEMGLRKRIAKEIRDKFGELAPYAFVAEFVEEGRK